MTRALVWTGVALALGVFAWQALPGRLVVDRDDVVIERRPGAAYDRLFPYYVELCAVSQFRSKTKGTGGVPGHAAMYVKGACHDEAAPHPQLRRCRRVARDPDDPEHGAGVSVNRWFRNVNWVATPGRRLFYAGELEPGERLTRERFDATVSRAIEAGIFRGVELHDDPTAPERSLRDFVEHQSLATDFALRFGRTVFCARMPITEPMLVEVMGFLNELNLEFATGEADYEWSGVSDNCVHTLRNALAAAGVWSPITVGAVRLQALLNLAIPANEFVNLARLGAEGPIADYSAVFADDYQRASLMEQGWLPTRHGAVVKVLPVHAENDLYESRMRMAMLQSPFRRGVTEAAVRLLGDERFVSIRPNLEHFAGVYRGILAERDEEAFGLASLRGDRYRRVRRRYYEYVEAQLAEVEAMQRSLPAPGG